MRDVELTQVIVTNLTLRGEGVFPSPIRPIRQFWTPEGVLLGEVDPHLPGRVKQLQHLCNCCLWLLSQKETKQLVSADWGDPEAIREKLTEAGCVASCDEKAVKV